MDIKNIKQELVMELANAMFYRLSMERKLPQDIVIELLEILDKKGLLKTHKLYKDY